MKNAFLLCVLYAGVACQAAESAPPPAPPALSASAAQALKARCPKAVPKLGKMPSGDYEVRVRYVLKADGSTDNIRTEGNAPREARRLVASAYADLRCVPGETDQELTATFSLKTHQD